MVSFPQTKHKKTIFAAYTAQSAIHVLHCLLECLVINRSPISIGLFLYLTNEAKESENNFK